MLELPFRSVAVNIIGTLLIEAPKIVPATIFCVTVIELPLQLSILVNL